MKICRYLRLPDNLVSGFFLIFAASWVVTRHILFSFVIYSAYKDAPRLIPFLWAPESGHYLTRNAYIWFIALMVALQVLESLLQLCSTAHITPGYSISLAIYSTRNHLGCH